MAGLTGADAPSWVPPIPASLGAKRAAGVPKSRPLSLVGRENTPGSAEIAPNRSTPVRNPSALRPTSANICRRWRPMEMNRASQVPGMAASLPADNGLTSDSRRLKQTGESQRQPWATAPRDCPSAEDRRSQPGTFVADAKKGDGVERHPYIGACRRTLPD